MKTLYRILGAGALCALAAAPIKSFAQQEPIIAVDITKIGVNSGSGSVLAVNLTSLGSGYSAAPAVTVSGGGGVGAQLTATVIGGAVTALSIVDGGTGYTSSPT